MLRCAFIQVRDLLWEQKGGGGLGVVITHFVLTGLMKICLNVPNTVDSTSLNIVWRNMYAHVCLVCRIF